MPSRATSTTTLPSGGVCRSALSIRLTATCVSCATIGIDVDRLPARRARGRSPSAAARCANVLTVDVATSLRSKRSRRSGTVPDSERASSSKSSTRRIIRSTSSCDLRQEQRARFGVVVGNQHRFEHQLHRRERRAQLVRDVADEIAAHAARPRAARCGRRRSPSRRPRTAARSRRRTVRARRRRTRRRACGSRRRAPPAPCRSSSTDGNDLDQRATDRARARRRRTAAHAAALKTRTRAARVDRERRERQRVDQPRGAVRPRRSRARGTRAARRRAAPARARSAANVATIPASAPSDAATSGRRPCPSTRGTCSRGCAR